MKKTFYPLLMSLLLIFLVACTSEKDLTEEWHDRAENTDFMFHSNDGYQLLFGPEGLSVWDTHGDSGFVDSTISPFEAGKTYPDYEITKKDEIITIKTGEDLEFDLKIVGERLYRDEKNERDYFTDSYLFREEESKK